MNTNFDFRTANPAEVIAWSIEKFSGLRKEYADYLAAPMLVACNSVVIVNNDNGMTIGVDREKHCTKLVRGNDFPCTFTPEKAREICENAACRDGEGNLVPMQVKNIATYCREQIAMCDNMLETLKKSPYYNA